MFWHTAILAVGLVIVIGTVGQALIRKQEKEERAQIRKTIEQEEFKKRKRYEVTQKHQKSQGAQKYFNQLIRDKIISPSSQSPKDGGVNNLEIQRGLSLKSKQITPRSWFSRSSNKTRDQNDGTPRSVSDFIRMQSQKSAKGLSRYQRKSPLDDSTPEGQTEIERFFIDVDKNRRNVELPARRSTLLTQRTNYQDELEREEERLLQAELNEFRYQEKMNELAQQLQGSRTSLLRQSKCGQHDSLMIQLQKMKSLESVDSWREILDQKEKVEEILDSVKQAEMMTTQNSERLRSELRTNQLIDEVVLKKKQKLQKQMEVTKARFGFKNHRTSIHEQDIMKRLTNMPANEKPKSITETFSSSSSILSSRNEAKPLNAQIEKTVSFGTAMTARETDEPRSKVASRQSIAGSATARKELPRSQPNSTGKETILPASSRLLSSKSPNISNGLKPPTNLLRRNTLQANGFGLPRSLGHSSQQHNLSRRGSQVSAKSHTSNNDSQNSQGPKDQMPMRRSSFGGLHKIKYAPEIAQLQLSYAELDQKCIEFFKVQKQRIEFKVRKGNDLEEQISSVLDELQTMVPIQHVDGSSYLLGDKVKFFQIQGNLVQIRIGGGWETLKTYILKNQKQIERNLAISMMKNNKGLKWVVDQLMENQKYNIRIIPTGTVGCLPKPPFRGSSQIVQPGSVPDFMQLQSTIDARL